MTATAGSQGISIWRLFNETREPNRKDVRSQESFEPFDLLWPSFVSHTGRGCLIDHLELCPECFGRDGTLLIHRSYDR